MKIGDYVRTNEFGIQKVKWFDNEEPILENGFTALQSSGYKSSPNIIDLIEVGDYVNGEQVYESRYHELYISYVYCGGIGVRTTECYATFINDMKEEDIETIVTKEQFEQMEYKVKE